MKKDQKEKINQASLLELEKELIKETQDLAKLMIDKSLAKLKNTCQVRELKHKIAFLKTRISQKKFSKTNND